MGKLLSTKNFFEFFVKDIKFRGREDVIKLVESDPKRPLLWLAQHGPAHSWFVIPGAIARAFEGYEWMRERRPLILFHELVYKIPILSSLAFSFLEGERPKSFLQIIKWVKEKKYTDIGTMPEGVNCNFLFDRPIGPFMFHGGLYLALLLDMPIVLMVHRGLEDWSKEIKISNFFSRKGFYLPLFPKKIEDLRVDFFIYTPSIELKDIRNKSKKEMNWILGLESEKMRVKMLDHYTYL